MLCPNCKTENKDGALYCASCGAPLPKAATAKTEPAAAPTGAPDPMAPPTAPQDTHELLHPAMQKQPVFLPRRPHDEQASGKTKAYLAKRRVFVGIAAVFTAFFASVVLLGVVNFIKASANAKPIPAASFEPASSTVGEYVTTDLIYVLPLYQEGYEKRGVEHIETYTCLAIDVYGNMFTIETSYDYYQDALCVLEAEELPENFDAADAVTVYGDVMTPDAEIQSEIIAEVGNNAVVSNMYAHNGLRVIREPRTTLDEDDNSFVAFFFAVWLAAAVGFLVCMIKRLRRAQVLFAAYGNFVDLGEAVKAAPLYQDARLCVNADYLVSRKNPLLFAHTSDVLCVYQYEHRTRFLLVSSTDKLALIVHDRYGEKMAFYYKPNAKEKGVIQQAIRYMAPLFPNAVFGYTKENLQYVATYQIDV